MSPRPPRVPSEAADRLRLAARAHRPVLGRRLVGPFSLFSSAVFAIGLVAFLTLDDEAGIAVVLLAVAIRTAEAYDAWTRMPPVPPSDDRRR